nr:hypothetical protein [Tanacetum cinerariifolium]
MVKNLEGRVKFLMFPRFMQVFLDKQVEGMFKHKEIYVIPSYTKKVFANMKRQRKDFSGRVTPLFLTMIVQAQEELEVVADDAVYEAIYVSVERVATTATGVDAEQDRGIISKIQFTETLNETSSIRNSSGSGPRRQETIRDAAAQTRIIDNLDADEGVTLVDETQGRNDQDMFNTYVLDDGEVVAEKEVSTAYPVTTTGEVVTTAGVEVSTAATTPIIFMDDITLAKALASLKSEKPMVKESSVPVSAASNSPKDMYDSWKSRMELYMLNRQHGRMILESVKNDPLLWPTVEEDGVTRLKKYSELSAAEAIQANCDVNTTFLNTLPPEWSKFITDVKLVRDLHTTNVDQLHAYLGQHEYHANEVRLMHERTSNPLALVAQHHMNKLTYQQHQQSYHQHQFQPQASTYQSSPYTTQYHPPQYASQAPSSSNLSISYPPNDIQSSINHNVYMASSSIPQMEYAPTVHQQSKTSSNPRQQATINNERVTIQSIQGRQHSMTVGSSRPYASGSGGALVKHRVIMCYNCKGEGHMSKQCTKPKRKQDAEWFKDKVLVKPT